MTDVALFGIGIVTLVLVVVVIVLVASRPRKKNPSKKDKALKELKALKEKMQPPAEVKKLDAPLLLPLPSTTLEQLPISQTIAIELTRIKEGTTKRATVRKGKVTLVQRFGSNKEQFWFFIGKAGYFIDPSKIITVRTMVGRRRKHEVVTEKLVYDVLHSEPLDSTGSLTWSPDVEHLWRDSALDQYITVATFEGGFQLTPGLVKILIVVGALGLLTGIAINGSTHIVPTTLIHWIPR